MPALPRLSDETVVDAVFINASTYVRGVSDWNRTEGEYVIAFALVNEPATFRVESARNHAFSQVTPVLPEITHCGSRIRAFW